MNLDIQKQDAGCIKHEKREYRFSFEDVDANGIITVVVAHYDEKALETIDYLDSILGTDSENKRDKNERAGIVAIYDAGGTTCFANYEDLHNLVSAYVADIEETHDIKVSDEVFQKLMDDITEDLKTAGVVLPAY